MKKTGSEPHQYLGKSDASRRAVSAKALRCLEKNKECGGEFARRQWYEMRLNSWPGARSLGLAGL